MAAVVRILVTVLVVAAFSTPTHAFCWAAAGAAYGLSPDVLKAVSAVESNHNQTAVHLNKNGSYDVCHMQINSGWYFRLKRRYGKGFADRAWSGLADPCYCTKFGAYVLSDCISRYGDNWRSVGCYNAGDSAKKAGVYARKVRAKWLSGR
jgi:soluble lytic murein transglycosylase-like protein